MTAGGSSSGSFCPPNVRRRGNRRVRALRTDGPAWRRNTIALEVVTVPWRRQGSLGGALQPQKTTTKERRQAPSLTALDYIEIEQLVYRYGWALDSGADNGYAYADLYASDGTSQGPTRGRAVVVPGRDRLAALARGGKRGPAFVSHYVTNVIIEPTADGAVGRTYVAIFDIGNGGNGAKSRLDHGGLYNDVYVKTDSGWRFKTRTYYESKSGEPVQPPPALVAPPRVREWYPRRPKRPRRSAKKGPSLTVEDYIEIQQLVSRYPYALDVDPDEGASYANLFTPTPSSGSRVPRAVRRWRNSRRRRHTDRSSSGTSSRTT